MFPSGATYVRACLVILAGVSSAGLVTSPSPALSDPFAPLEIYEGEWTVQAAHPWSGAPAGRADRLSSRCHHFTIYFACEQTVDGKPLTLIIYTKAGGPDRFNTRVVAPNGLAGGRGDLMLQGGHWTYLDKPPAGLKGPWSRVENEVLDHNHIRFEEYQSTDGGRTWSRTNAGIEARIGGA